MVCLCDFSVGDFCVFLLILVVATLMHFIILLIKPPLVVFCHCFSVSIEFVVISPGNSTHCIVRIVRGTKELSELNFQIIYCQIQCCRHLFVVDAKLLRVEEQSPQIIRNGFQKLWVIFQFFWASSTGSWWGPNIFWYPVVKKLFFSFFSRSTFFCQPLCFLTWSRGFFTATVAQWDVKQWGF